MLLLQCAIKMSDVGHTSKGPENHMKWTEKIMEEFFEQGDNEKQLGVCGLLFFCIKSRTSKCFTAMIYSRCIGVKSAPLPFFLTLKSLCNFIQCSLFI
jgi:hypothetical protein